MKKIIFPIAAISAICVLTGCETTGISPRESSGASYQSYIMSLQTGSTNAPQQVITPIRLAVAQVGEAAPPESMIDRLAKDKSQVASVNGMPLPGDVYYGLEDYPGRIKKLCNLARSTGADFVFLFGGTMDSWMENNSWSALDGTLVGGAIFPGTKIHVQGKAGGALISTTICQPIFFADADASQTRLSPDYFCDGKKVGLQATVRDQLAAKLTEQLMDKLSAAAIH